MPVAPCLLMPNRVGGQTQPSTLLRLNDTPYSSPQLGIPHSFALISYQHKFQDDDQTRVKGSLK